MCLRRGKLCCTVLGLWNFSQETVRFSDSCWTATASVQLRPSSEGCAQWKTPTWRWQGTSWYRCVTGFTWLHNVRDSDLHTVRLFFLFCFIPTSYGSIMFCTDCDFSLNSSFSLPKISSANPITWGWSRHLKSALHLISVVTHYIVRGGK